MAYQQRGGGNYGNQRNSNYGGGNGSRGGFRGPSRRGGGNSNGPSNYLRSSTFVKNVILEGEDGRKEPAPLTPGVTEEIAITLTAAKVEELFTRLQDAQNDPQGDGGVRITMYCQNKTNQDTGEEFDGCSMMIVGKFPPRNQQQGNKSFGGGNRGGGGRRNYQQPDYQNNSPEGDGGGNDQGAARGGTSQRGQQSRGSQTQGSQVGGRTQNAQKSASHSEPADTGNQYDQGGADSGYSEEPGW
jgi:hypothetical protein